MKIAMIFPGYGSQFVGMGKELYDQHRLVQEYFEEASNCLNVNFVKLCFASSDAELSRLNNAYTSLFLVSCAIAALLKEQNIIPDIIAGYNQGEYAALCAGGGMTFPDGLYLLNKYATFYQEALDSLHVGALEIKGINAHDLEDMCLKAGAWAQGQVYIALYQGPDRHTVAGDFGAIERLRELASTVHNVEIHEAHLGIGMHSPLMKPIVDNFKIYLEKVDFKQLAVPMIDGINGYPLGDDAAIREHIVKYIDSPVVWPRVMAALHNYDIIIEIGPGSSLLTLIKESYPDKMVIAINKNADIEELRSMITQSNTLQDVEK